jgi:hypothetical protein
MLAILETVPLRSPISLLQWLLEECDAVLRVGGASTRADGKANQLR